MNKWFLGFLSVAILGALFFIKNEPFRPKLEAPYPSPSVFLSQELQFEKKPFHIEYSLACQSLHDLSLQSTLYGFKKAYLVSETHEEKSKAFYGLIFTYFLAKKWDELKKLYVSDHLESLDGSAAYFQDALIMFYIAFKELQVPFVTQEIGSILDKDSKIKDTFSIIDQLKIGSIQDQRLLDAHKMFLDYKKSSLKASLLNLLPGAGYLYLHQKQTALTAFLLMGLLGLALFQLTRQKHFASAFLVFSIFTGFYWGSIVGANQNTDFYNQTLFSSLFDPLLKQHKLYPELLITHAP
jgi:hypothetical protein